MKKILLFIVCFFSSISSSLALTLNCPEVASPGEIIKCGLQEDSISGLKVKYQLEQGIVYQNLYLNDNWNNYYHGSDGFSVGKIKNEGNLSFEIEFKISDDVLVNKDYTVNLTEIEKSTTDYTYLKLDNVSDKIRIVSDINTLDSLKISNGKLSPNFDKNINSYKATVKSDKTVINATLSDSSAKIEGDIGERKLNYGGNKFVIKVISQRGNAKEYSIYITRPLEEVKKDNDISLKSLSLSHGKIDFQKDKFLYDVNVDYDIDNIEVMAIPNSDKAKIEIQKEEKLEVGENIIKVIVTAEDSTVGTYVIVVNRKEKLSNDASIKNLVIDGYDLDFKSDDYQYELLIGKEDKLDIQVELNDDKAEYIINGNNNLKNKSIIEIKVTAEDGSEQSYKINIIKQNESNSSFITNYIKVVPLIIFILLIIVLLIVKKLKNKVNENNM